LKGFAIKAIYQGALTGICCAVFHGGRISNRSLISPSINNTIERRLWITPFFVKKKKER